jgi:hypothetical protein
MIEALKGHKALFDANVYNLNDYGTGFRKLIEKAFGKSSP